VKSPPYVWIASGILFAAATVWINYEVKVNIQTAAADGTTREVGNIKVGQPAPDFAAKDLADQTVRLADYRGQKVVLIDFWATWCGPCRMAMPGLQSVQDDLKGRGLEITRGGATLEQRGPAEAGRTDGSNVLDVPGGVLPDGLLRGQPHIPVHF
jgi:cytochrome oxidase Cu insertion factor (SCO1/SenC/PrrC family)